MFIIKKKTMGIEISWPGHIEPTPPVGDV